jgi:hypothetical protein
LVNWEAEREKMKNKGSGDYVKDGDLINLDEVVEIEEISETWADEKGGEEVRSRMMYHLKDRSVKVPMSVHKKILDRQKDGFFIVRIDKKGSGKLGTKYEVVGWERRK